MWADTWFEGLNPTEKLLWVYLLTNPHTNMLGIYQISIKRIKFDCGINDETLSKALKRFRNDKKAFFLFEEWMFLPNWMKNQSMNTNMVKSARKIYTCLPNTLIEWLEGNAFESFESLSKGRVTLPNLEIEIESEIEKEIESEKGDKKINYKSNVKLTEKEYLQLEQQYGVNDVAWMIEKLSAYKESKGKTYKSDAGAIRSWVVDELSIWKNKNNGHDNKDNRGNEAPVKRRYTESPDQ